MAYHPGAARWSLTNAPPFRRTAGSSSWNLGRSAVAPRPLRSKHEQCVGAAAQHDRRAQDALQAPPEPCGGWTLAAPPAANRRPRCAPAPTSAPSPARSHRTAPHACLRALQRAARRGRAAGGRAPRGAGRRGAAAEPAAAAEPVAGRGPARGRGGGGRPRGNARRGAACARGARAAGRRGRQRGGAGRRRVGVGAPPAPAAAHAAGHGHGSGRARGGGAPVRGAFCVPSDRLRSRPHRQGRRPAAKRRARGAREPAGA